MTNVQLVRAAAVCTAACALLGAGPALPALAIQVALDRAGFSPGEIDGRNGRFTMGASAAFTAARQAAIEPAAEPVVQYTITEADAAGPFVNSMPTDLEQQAFLAALGYTSLVEALAERFHASPRLLKALNPTATFAAGSTISVPNVEPFVLPSRQGDRRQVAGTNATAASLELSRDTQAVIARDASGGVLFYAPVTVGSEQDPLPVGDWKITGLKGGPWELYDLSKDRAESHDLAAVKPEKLRELTELWEKQWTQIQADATADLPAGAPAKGAGTKREQK